MHKIKALTLFTVLLITGCQSVDSTKSQTKVKQGSEPFLIYSVPEGPRTVVASSITAEFRYEDGCLLVFNGAELMTPAFPEGDAKFNIENKTLKILNTEYKMGEVVVANGNTASINSINTFNNTVPSKCVKEYIAVFFGSYEKTAWN